MNAHTKELIEKVMYEMRKCRNVPNPKVSEDISHLEAHTMFHILRVNKKCGEQVNVTALADKLSVSMQSLSRTVKNLERKGYIIREVDSQNRRNTLVKLSEKGERVLEENKNNMENYFYRVFSHFNDEELQHFIDFQEKFYRVILEEHEKDRQKNQKKTEKEN